MIGLQLLPVVFSLIILGAHFLRAGNVALVGLACLALALLGVRRPLAARLVQAALVFRTARIRGWYSTPPKPR